MALLLASLSCTAPAPSPSAGGDASERAGRPAEVVTPPPDDDAVAASRRRAPPDDDAVAAARPVVLPDDQIRLAEGDAPVVRVARLVVTDRRYATERAIHADGASVRRVEPIDPAGEPVVERRELGRRFVLRLLRDLNAAGVLALDPRELAGADPTSPADGPPDATTTLEVRLPSGVRRWTVRRLDERRRSEPDSQALAILSRGLDLVDGLLPERAP